MKILLVLLTILSAEVFAAPEVAPPNIPFIPWPGATGNKHYVDNVNGVDTGNLTGEIDTPWLTLKHAVANIAEGDTLTLKCTGVPYVSNFTEITIVGTGWTVVQGATCAEGTQVEVTGRVSIGNNGGASAAYINLHNLKFVGEGGSGLNIRIHSDSNNLLFSNLEFDCQSHPNNTRAVWTDPNVSDMWFSHVYVHHCSYEREFDDPATITQCGGICIAGDNIDRIVFSNVTSRYNIGDGLGGSSVLSFSTIYFDRVITEFNTGDGIDIGGTTVVLNRIISRNNGGHQGEGIKTWSKYTWILNSQVIDNAFSGLNTKPRHTGASVVYVDNTIASRNSKGVYGAQMRLVPQWPPPGTGTMVVKFTDSIIHGESTAGILIENTEEFRNKTVEWERTKFISTQDAVNYPSPHPHYVYAIHARDMDAGSNLIFIPENSILFDDIEQYSTTGAP